MSLFSSRGRRWALWRSPGVLSAPWGSVLPDAVAGSFSIALKEALLGKQLLSVWKPVGGEAAKTPEGMLSCECRVFKTGTNLKSMQIKLMP